MRDLTSFIAQLEEALTLRTEPFLARVDNLKSELAASLEESERREVLLLAMKIANLFVVRHDYLHRRVRLHGRPVGFMLDPANGCQLGCATCANTFNKDYASKVLNPWPRGVMKPSVFSEIIADVGPWAFVGHFYNNSEPYLNKQTHAYIKRAAQLRVRTSTSSNMSLPNLDVGAIVESGLDDLQVAIDGVSQGVYERYRRGGDIALAFENVRRLMEERARRGSRTPFVRWHYLTFEHNVHELDAAIDKARELGVDFFFIVPPIDVSGDDPTVRAVHHARAYEGIHLTPPDGAPMLTDISPAAEAIEQAFAKPYTERYAGEENEPETAPNHCDWLYMATIFDAGGRVFPCCIGDTKGHGTFQFGAITHGHDVMNSSEYRTARLFVNGGRSNERVRCHTCHGRPVPQVGLNAVRDSMQRLSGYQTWLTPDVINTLAGWSQHVV